MTSQRRAQQSSNAAAVPSEEDFEAFGVNAALVEEIRQRYEVDPDSVHANWGPVFGDQEIDRTRDVDASPGRPEEVELAVVAVLLSLRFAVPR